MTDNDRIIKDIQFCISNIPGLCSFCSKNETEEINCREELLKESLELLKERQAVKPDIDGHSCRCGRCDDFIMSDLQAKVPINRERIRFCAHCGQPIDWQELEQGGE